MAEAEDILGRFVKGQRISEKEVLILFQKGELLLLGQIANQVLRRFHNEDEASYIIDRNINYTNICSSRCKFCAFYREEEDPEAYVLNKEEIFKKIEETIALNGTQIMLQGGLHPDLNITYFTDLLSCIKNRYNVHIHSFSPPEILHIARVSSLSIRKTLKRLHDAGLDSLPGGGAEILVDHVRAKISPNKIRSDNWLDVMKEAHRMGMKTTATMMLGSIEAFEDRAAHLLKLRDVQDRTGGFRAFIPWTFQPNNTELGGRVTSSVDYLKTLAISRIFLDNFENIQGSWVTQGKEIGQITLCFGANDLGSIMIEENVVKAAGVSYKMSEDEMIKLIKACGKKAVKRNTKYEKLAVF
ncbi:MAG: cyclic dehypoxanthinyl futalosine synthase [Thermodesulfobacteriota bacterium]|nr:cyclic dehypoxanthinyl futalosine synthase [Thermodesulfobacteriota bacterium]